MDIGHFYFLKPDYSTQFEFSHFMNNHEDERNRPYFCAFKDKDLYWLIPISSKLAKFERVYRNKIDKYGKCDTIDFCDVLGHRKAFLIQNMCPVTPEYITNEYCDADSHLVQIADKSRKRIASKAKKVLALHRKGYNLIFGDVFTIEKELLAHL